MIRKKKIALTQSHPARGFVDEQKSKNAVKEVQDSQRMNWDSHWQMPLGEICSASRSQAC